MDASTGRSESTKPGRSILRPRRARVEKGASLARRPHRRPLRHLAASALGRRAGADALLRRLLALADVTAALLAALVVGTVSGSVEQGAWAAVFAPAWVVLAKLHGLYDRDQRALRHLTVDELSSLAFWSLTGAGALTVLLMVAPPATFDAGDIIWTAGVVFVVAACLRVGARAVWRWVTPRESALIVGEGPLAGATRRKLELFADIHVHVADARTKLGPPSDDPPAVDRIIVASQAIDEREIADLVVFCRRHRVKLSVVPPARGMFGTAVQLNHVADLPVLEYNTWDVSRSTMALKRVLDVTIGGLALLLTAPLVALVALAIRLNSRGPVLFTQTRAGRGGKPFRMLKFRTMVDDAEARLGDVVRLDALPEPVFKLRSDPRVTRVGRVLRRTSLDELPQLWNVLLGDMSLVGPRPEQLDLVERYTDEQRIRLAVKPGITGPMQVHGRGELTLAERLAVEREYIENLSVGRDLRILGLTVAAVASGRGAF
jgi:exopolysaccharide biosynthesis polyprenyl glycosylphosphotransferase